MTQLLTHSRKETFQLCRRKHKYAYIDGIRPTLDAKALRMGSAGHDGCEQLAKGRGLNAACEVIYQRYDRCPETYEQLEWEYERETVLRLVCGYDWRWKNDELVYLAAERSFQLPLVNPETGKPTPVWNRGGKIDGIVQSTDGRVGVKETKFLSEDIDADAVLWKRMQVDGQISSYVNAARDMGFPASYVLYDVIRKPTIRPSQLPLCDDLGLPIVLDERGNRARTAKGEPRMTGDKAKGYTLQTRPMTAEEWGNKLAADIAERPEFYYQRREIARLDKDLEEYARELWDIQRDMRDAEINNKHYRTINRETCQFCSYFGMCVANRGADDLPEGFVVIGNVNPELGELSHGSDTSASRSDGQSAAATETFTAPAIG